MIDLVKQFNKKSLSPKIMHWSAGNVISTSNSTKELRKLTSEEKEVFEILLKAQMVLNGL